jgi:hypothetical protein
MNRQRVVVACLLLVVPLALGAEQVKPRLPSSYAPAKDLTSQVDALLKSMESDLEDKEEFGKDQTGRISLNANALAAVALVLGKHDQPSELQKAAPAMIAAASKLASASGDFDKATAALANVKTALKSSGDASQLKWEPVADAASLMLHVPVVNNSLRRGVTGRRFSRSADKLAGYAAQLAAIAQATAFDTDYCEDEKQEALWQKSSFMMRDGAADVLAAIRKDDQAAAKMGLATIVKSCDACHATFRSE